MRRSDMTCAVEELWHEQEDSRQEPTQSTAETMPTHQLDYPRDFISEGRSDSPARLWLGRPVSLSSASSSDSGVRGDFSDASSSRLPATGLSADSGSVTWEEMDEGDWDDCCSDASGEYEPLREPRKMLVDHHSSPFFNRSLTYPPPPPPPPSPPPPPPPRPPPGTLPRRKDLTRHLGLPRELGGSLAELSACPVARRKDLALFLGMTEPNTPQRPGLWRRWASRRGQRSERERLDGTSNGSLPDLARFAVGTETASTPSTPSRRRAAASPRLLRAALRRVQERALRAVARPSSSMEVAGLGDDSPTLLFQAKRESFEAPSVLFSGDRWQAPAAGRPSPLSVSALHRPRLPTPPPEPPTPAVPSTHSWSPGEWAAADLHLPPPPPELPPSPADAEDEPAYMTMEAIRALPSAPLPPPRVTVCPCGEEDEESDYLSMDAVRQLSRRAPSPFRPRLGSDYANLADLKSALAGLKLSAGSPAAPES